MLLQSTNPMSLDAVKVLFDDWRANRGKLGPFPEDYWRCAVALLQHHDATTICSTLRISNTQLKMNIERFSAATQKASGNDDFIAVTIPASAISPQPAAEIKSVSQASSLSIELMRPDGISLKIQSLPYQDVQSLLTFFIGR